jgi:hypothetical protein
MKYLGPARKEKGCVIMPDTFRDVPEGQVFEAVEVGGDIVLAIPPLDKNRLDEVKRLADRSIADHRKSLEGLAR